jgi:hypothetical protein
VSALADWVLLAALHFAPIETRPRFEGFEETQEEAFGRYLGISADIAAAAEEHAGTDAEKRRRAALLLAVAVGESGLSRDVDEGPCYRRGGWKARCDSGTSHTLWQMKAAMVDGRAVHARELRGFDKRPQAARAALRALSGSLGACRQLEARDRLSMYGSGSCRPGLKSVRARWALFERVVAFEAPTK